jgi:hypothetical protein
LLRAYYDWPSYTRACKNLDEISPSHGRRRQGFDLFNLTQ